MILIIIEGPVVHKGHVPGLVNLLMMWEGSLQVVDLQVRGDTAIPRHEQKEPHQASRMIVSSGATLLWDLRVASE